MNDAFVLLCERPCTGGGGGNFLVDAAATAAALEKKQDSAWLVPELQRRMVNQTSTCTCTECVPDGVPLKSLSPIMQTLSVPGNAWPFNGGERKFFRLFSDQRPLDEEVGEPEAESSNKMLTAYHAAMRAEAKAAPRFYCEAGDALIIGENKNENKETILLLSVVLMHMKRPIVCQDRLGMHTQQKSDSNWSFEKTRDVIFFLDVRQLEMPARARQVLRQAPQPLARVVLDGRLGGAPSAFERLAADPPGRGRGCARCTGGGWL
eukprot:COSAG06_NODE_6540_length_2889_cov_20.829317_5_plen_264_part_00